MITLLYVVLALAVVALVWVIVEGFREFYLTKSALSRAITDLKNTGKTSVFEQVIWKAQTCWAIPQGGLEAACDEDDGRFPCLVSDRSSTLERNVLVCYPFHDIMAGGSACYTNNFRQRLWRDERWRRAVAFVLQHLTSAEVEAWCNAREGDGYVAPMIASLREALRQGLVGISLEHKLHGSFTELSKLDPDFEPVERRILQYYPEIIKIKEDLWAIDCPE